MWKKILPIAAVLLLAWIVLNLITDSNGPEPDKEVVATTESDDASSKEEVAEGDASEAVIAPVASLATAESTDDNEAASTETSGDTAETTTETETAAADTASDSSEAESETTEAAAESAETDTAETDTAEADTAEASTDSTEAASTEAASEDTSSESTESASTTEAASEDTSSESTETTATTEAASEDASSESTEAVAAGIAQMRYPVDPETGATLFDQGMVEVIIEPEVIEPEADVATEDTSGVSEEQTDVASSETASDEQDSSEPAAEVVMAMRYPTDPETGATIFDGGMVEVAIEVTVDEVAESTEPESDSEESVAQEPASTEGRLPVDPVTGATIFADADDAAADDEDASSESSGPSNSMPTDPVTGATIFASADGDSDASSADSDGASNKLPTDPVTGATVFAGSGDAADASAEGKLPTDPVTGATIHSDADSSEEASTDSASTSSTTAIRQPGDLSGISRKIGGVFGSTSAVLARSKDEASAKAALPILVTASESLGELAEQFQTLPESTTSILGQIINTNMAKLKPQADTAMVKSGVGSVLSPVLIPMMEQLQNLTQ